MQAPREVYTAYILCEVIDEHDEMYILIFYKIILL